MLVNIQTTSERADGRTMDCLEVTLMWSLLMRIALILHSSILRNVFKKKKKKKKTKKLSSKHGTARLSARLSARKRALCKCCTCRTAQRRPVSNGSGAARQAVQFKGVLDHRN